MPLPVGVVRDILTARRKRNHLVRALPALRLLRPFARQLGEPLETHQMLSFRSLAFILMLSHPALARPVLSCSPVLSRQNKGKGNE